MEPNPAHTPEELELINQFTKKTLTAEDVYTFQVVLCDNEIDRDFERFTTDALHALCELFPGKTGVFDHSMKGKDQTARVYKTWVDISKEKQNSAGEPYACLMARAYMPRTGKNEDLITEIDAGIKKEVSISCSMGTHTCSVCGRDARQGVCEHISGQSYGGKVCHRLLSDPKDAYEWSFVAVPAQPRAGVTKQYKRGKQGEKPMTEQILKSLQTAKSGVQLSKAQAEALLAYVTGLQKKAAFAADAENSLREEVTALCGMTLPEMDRKAFRKIADSLQAEELMQLKKAFEAQAQEHFPIRPQLQPEHEKQMAPSHQEFKI